MPVFSRSKTIGEYEYKSKNKIGNGCFGRVYKGKHKKTKDYVAIKVLDNSKTIDMKYVQREEQVLKKLDALNNDNLIKFFACLKDDYGEIHLIMEYCNEGDLKSYLSTKRRLDAPILQCFFRQIGNGLAALKQLKIVHRDLKPENILLCQTDHVQSNNLYPDLDLCIKIADFGLARFCTPSELQRSVAVGSPQYMAPELLKYDGKTSIDPNLDLFKADIWSVGLMMYECTMGSINFIDPKWKKEELQKFYETEILRIRLYREAMPSLQNLLESLLKTDTVERIDLEKFMEHKFFKKDLTNQVEKVRRNSLSGRPKTLAIHKDKEYAKVVIPFTPTKRTMLELREGEIVTIVAKIDEFWWKGERVDGKVGVFPPGFVKVLDQKPNQDDQNSPKEKFVFNFELLSTQNLASDEPPEEPDDEVFDHEPQEDPTEPSEFYEEPLHSPQHQLLPEAFLETDIDCIPSIGASQDANPPRPTLETNFDIMPIRKPHHVIKSHSFSHKNTLDGKAALGDFSRFRDMNFDSLTTKHAKTLKAKLDLHKEHHSRPLYDVEILKKSEEFSDQPQIPRLDAFNPSIDPEKPHFSDTQIKNSKTIIMVQNQGEMCQKSRGLVQDRVEKMDRPSTPERPITPNKPLPPPRKFSGYSEFKYVNGVRVYTTPQTPLPSAEVVRAERANSQPKNGAQDPTIVPVKKAFERFHMREKQMTQEERKERKDRSQSWQAGEGVKKLKDDPKYAIFHKVEKSDSFKNTCITKELPAVPEENHPSISRNLENAHYMEELPRSADLPDPKSDSGVSFDADSPSSTLNSAKDGVLYNVIAKFDWKDDLMSGELPISADEPLQAIDHSESKLLWWKVKNLDGRVGLVPIDFVQVDPNSSDANNYAGKVAEIKAKYREQRKEKTLHEKIRDLEWFCDDNCEETWGNVDGIGDFIIREDKNDPDAYMVVVKTPKEVKEFHMKVLANELGWFKFESRMFHSLENFIHHFIK